MRTAGGACRHLQGDDKTVVQNSLRSFVFVYYFFRCCVLEDGGWGRSFGAGWQIMLENNMENIMAKDAMA